MQLTKQQSRVVPRRGHQQDKYQGQVHPQTKLRHGQGHYQYDNQFFTYDGEYLQGKKQGRGALSLRDGTVITGTFQNDELLGPAEVKYSHGAVYTGNLQMGEKCGRGSYDSPYQFYDGDWQDNNKHGSGNYRNKSTGEEYVGQFQLNKFHGKGKLNSWNYSYEGDFQNGKKEGEGKETNEWLRQGEEGIGKYEYTGSFKQDQFQGQGEFRSKESQYVYTGVFSQGRPTLYPNEFRLWLSTNTKNGQDTVQSQQTLVTPTQPIEYELEGDSLNLYIQTVYQGPEVLDQVQPTQEEIDAMIKNWQNENKKNKNPPPMPDFTQPRMKKPQVVKVSQEKGRTISLKLIKQVEGKDEYLKVDYRSEMAIKRKENEQLRLEALKKAEEDAGKKGGKKDNKEPELKVNLFRDKPTKRQTVLNILTAEGSSELKGFELPDDFPAGKYILEISSPFIDFGKVQPLRKELVVKAKAPAKKK